MPGGGQREAVLGGAGAEKGAIAGRLQGEEVRVSWRLCGCVALGEFHDCIRRPCTSSWEEGGCSLHLPVFLLALLTAVPLTSAEGGNKGREMCNFPFLDSHLITVPDFPAAFAHLLLASRVEKEPLFHPVARD